MHTVEEIQDKANRCVNLYLPLKSIRLDHNISLWANTCDNIRRLYPRRGVLKLMQLDKLPREQ